MAYKDSMFDAVGVAALDPNVAAYKKFVKENLNQPNLFQFLQSEQGKKLDPNLAGAMLVLERLEKAKENAPQGPMPTTSVVQDLGMAALQRAQQQQMMAGRRQGMAQIPNPAMAQARFDSGIAQAPKQMAGGGPVAFQNRGLVPSMLPEDTNYQDIYERLKELPYSASVVPEALNPQDALTVYGIALDMGDEETANKLRPYLARSGMAEQMGGVFRSVREEKAEMGRQQTAAREQERLRAAEAEKQRVAQEKAGRIQGLRTGQATAPAIATTAAASAAGSPPSSIAAPTDLIRSGQGTPPPAGATAAPYDPMAPFRDLQNQNAAAFGNVTRQIGDLRTQVSDMGAAAERAKPRTRDVIFDEVSKTYDKLGIGEATKAYLANIKQREDELAKDYKQERWMSVAQAGFAMAQAAAQNPQAGFLGALSVGGMEGAKRYTSALKDYRKATSQLQDSKYAVAQAQENLRLNQNKEAQDILNRETQRYDTLRDRAVSANMDLTKTLIGAESAKYTADASVRSSMARLMTDPEFMAFSEQRAKGKGPTEALGAVAEARSVRGDTGDVTRAKAAFDMLGGDSELKSLQRRRNAGSLKPDEVQKLQQMEMLYQTVAADLNPMGLRLKQSGE